MQHIHFVIPDFVNEISTQSILSIRLATDGFSFCVHDIRGQLIALIHEPYELDNQALSLYQLKEYFEKYPLLNLQYAKIFLVTCTREKLLIPGLYYNEQAAATFYSFTQETHSDDHFLHNRIKDLDIYLETTFPKSIISFIQSHFPHVRIINSTYQFLIDASSQCENVIPQAYIAIEHQYFDLAIFNNDQLILFNTFDYRNNTDILYHVLNCIQTLKLEPQKVHLSLTGTSSQEALLQLIQRYIPDSRIKANNGALNTIPRDKSPLYASFYHLLNIHLCEL